MALGSSEAQAPPILSRRWRQGGIVRIDVRRTEEVIP